MLRAGLKSSEFGSLPGTIAGLVQSKMCTQSDLQLRQLVLFDLPVNCFCLVSQMRVLDENWKKAEDEVYRLDELVENIKQVLCEGFGLSSGHLLLVVQLTQG